MAKYYLKSKLKKKTREEELKAKGLRFVNFVWPEKEWNEIAEKAEAYGMKPNEFVWNILKGWLK